MQLSSLALSTALALSASGAFAKNADRWQTDRAGDLPGSFSAAYKDKHPGRDGGAGAAKQVRLDDDDASWSAKRQAPWAGGKADSFQAPARAELSPVAAVPEPETFALMLAGLAAVGFIARRRRKR